MPKQIYLFSTSTHPKATCIKSLDIKFLKPNIDFTKYNYFILTSKQAVKALNQYIKKDFIDIPALCVSSSTAKAYESIGGTVLDIGEGDGDSLGECINDFSKDIKWLYLRAQTVASEFAQTARNNGVNIDEKVVYVSDCSQEILNLEVQKSDILIFTSPSSVECFLKNNTINCDVKVVVIGKTTASSLPNNIECIISEKPSVNSCVELALKL